jgi:isoleucyl-tRNA synthetase
MTPILSVTAAEAWEHLYGLDQKSPIEESVFFAGFPNVDDIKTDKDLDLRWEKLLAVRGEITKVLEVARRDKVIGLSLDAEVLLQVEGEIAEFLADKLELLKELCIVSSLQIVQNPADSQGTEFVDCEEVEGLKVAVRTAPGNKCERCWIISAPVGEAADHPTICSRCAAVVRSLAG